MKLLRPLDLDGHSVKPPKAKLKVQTHTTCLGGFHFILCSKQPSNQTVKILLVFDFLMEWY
jgi:hypothetical protein